MNIQFIPGPMFQAPPQFLQQFLPDCLQHGRAGVYYPEDYYYTSGNGFEKAGGILQDHLEELYSYGTSQILTRSLEKLWQRDYDYLLAHNFWERTTPFTSVFTNLANLLSPGGDISGDYCFPTMSNFFMRHFDEMIDMSPQTALICFNGLDWMNQPMFDLVSTVGQEMSFLEEIAGSPVPFPFREHTLELVDEVMGQYSWGHQRRKHCSFGHGCGSKNVCNVRHPRLTLTGSHSHGSRGLQLPWCGGFNDGQTMNMMHGFPTTTRQLLSFGDGHRNHFDGGVFLRRPRGLPARLLQF